MEQEEQFEGLHAELTARIIKVFYAVANELGFFEVIYKRAMIIALRRAGLKVEEEVAIPVFFWGESVGTFSADIVVEGTVILELKPASRSSPSSQPNSPTISARRTWRSA